MSALIGPTTISGYGFKNALRLNEKGQLEITEELKSTLSELMDIQISSGRKRARCPMAGLISGHHDRQNPEENQAGLQILAETYWKIFKTVSVTEDQRTHQMNRIQEIRKSKGWPQ